MQDAAPFAKPVHPAKLRSLYRAIAVLANGLYGADVGPYSIADSIVRDLELAGIVDSKATYAKHVRDARFELAEATDRARLRATKANAIDLKSAA